MARTVVDRLYEDFTRLYKHLEDNKQLSLLNVVNDNFRKTLLVASGSHFEAKLTEELLKYFSEVVGTGTVSLKFVEAAALERRFHTWFNWKGSNANQFFALFGDEFKNYMRREAEEDSRLLEGERAFVEIGSERNRLVHEDFASYFMEKTTDEIYQLYQRGMYFIGHFPMKLRTFNQ